MKESIKIMKFNEMKTFSEDYNILSDLYDLSNKQITQMVNNLENCKNESERKEIVEDILLELDDIGLDQSKYNDFHKKLINYLDNQ